jgi:hypothetical protein
MAGRPPKIETVRNAFDAVRKSSDQLVTDITPFLSGSYQHGKRALKRKQAERIVAFSFLLLVAGWEEFVFWLTLRYMMGASAPNGFRPALVGARSHSLLAAARTLTGRPNFDPEYRYHVWKDWTEVIADAQNFFAAGQPFAAVTAADQTLLSYAQTIRNRVAHRSKKCVAEFRNIAKLHFGLNAGDPISNGTDAGRLLSSTVTHLFAPNANQRYYDAYSELFHRLSRQIAP